MRRYKYTWEETGTVRPNRRGMTCEIELVPLDATHSVKCVVCGIEISPAAAYWISAEDAEYDADSSMPIDAQPLCMDCIVQLAYNRDSLLGRE